MSIFFRFYTMILPSGEKFLLQTKLRCYMIQEYNYEFLECLFYMNFQVVYFALHTHLGPCWIHKCLCHDSVMYSRSASKAQVHAQPFPSYPPKMPRCWKYRLLNHFAYRNFWSICSNCVWGLYVKLWFTYIIY